MKNTEIGSVHMFFVGNFSILMMKYVSFYLEMSRKEFAFESFSNPTFLPFIWYIG